MIITHRATLINLNVPHTDYDRFYFINSMLNNIKKKYIDRPKSRDQFNPPYNCLLLIFISNYTTKKSGSTTTSFYFV